MASDLTTEPTAEGVVASHDLGVGFSLEGLRALGAKHLQKVGSFGGKRWVHLTRLNQILRDLPGGWCPIFD